MLRPDRSGGYRGVDAGRLLRRAMRNRRNYYRILYVQPDAPVEIIRCSYRTLMQGLKQHPDLGGDPGYAALINEAYAVLADPVRRADYDRQLSLPSRGAASDPDQPPAHAACAFCHAPHAEGAPLESDSLCAVCGSPLYPAAKRRLERSGRRGVARIGTQQRIKFFTAWPQAAAHVGEAQDISPKGLRFVSAHAVVVGQVLKLECEPCSAVVRVVDCLELRAEGRMRWLVRAEFLTVRFQDPRGGFVSAWV